MDEDSKREIGVGVSDKAILAVSVVGFGLLSFIVYKLILMRVQSLEEFEKAEEERLDYDEQLDRADVATLNRAQRRARAKNIMKRQRRIANEEQQEVEEAEEASPQTHLSRKQRQMAAKAAEREERKLFESQRKELQKEAMEEAQREKRERERLEAERLEAERKQRQQAKEVKEREEYKQWNTFLVSGDDTMTVGDFFEYMDQHKTVSIDELAGRFHTPSTQVRKRIRELVTSCRLTGVIDGDTFIHITHDEMVAIASVIREQGQVTLQDVAKATQSIIQQ